MRKWLVRGLLAAALMTSPLLLIAAILVLNVWNPMVLLFQFPFEVVNGSGEFVYVTPIGVAGAKGNRYILPQYASEMPAVPAFRQGGFGLAPGERLRIVYDWDDINFSEIVVTDAQGVARMLVVDENPTEAMYRPPQADRFVIPPLDELPLATDAMAWAAYEGHYSWRIWGFLLSPLIPAALFVSWRRLRRASRGAASRMPSAS